MRRGMRWAAQWFYPARPIRCAAHLVPVAAPLPLPCVGRARERTAMQPGDTVPDSPAIRPHAPTHRWWRHCAIAVRRPGTRTNGDAAWQHRARFARHSSSCPYAPIAPLPLPYVGRARERMAMQPGNTGPDSPAIRPHAPTHRWRRHCAIAVRGPGTRTNGDAAWRHPVRFARHSSSCPYEFAHMVQCDH